MDTITPAKIEVRPLTILTGAEISGVDLKQPLAPDVVDAIWSALLKWKVVFFRDQHLDHAQQIAMGRCFGDLTIGHQVYGQPNDYPEIYPVTKEQNADRYTEKRLVTPWDQWHSDVSPAANPPKASILRGEVIPPFGGDTQWTNLVAAFEDLSAPMRGFLETLRAVHRYPIRDDNDDQIRKRPAYSSEHPLVTVHPETGERVLWVAPAFVSHIVGLTPVESKTLLEMLWEQIIRPEFTVRFKWNPGDVGMWDNRATCHLPPSDVYATDDDRLMFRVTLMGEETVGVDGSKGRQLQGEPIQPPPPR